MVAVNNLGDHAFHPDLLIERPLVELAVADPVELVRFRFFVPGVKLETHLVPIWVYLHLA